MPTAAKQVRQLPEHIRSRVRLAVIVGLIICSVGSLVWLTFPSLLSIGLKSQMQIKEGNDLTKSWLEAPLAITIKAYIFTIDNPNEFAKGAKPVLREVGPYYFNQHRWKEIISWGPNQETITYWTSQSFNFDPDRTQGQLTDKITIVNVPVYAMSYVIKSLVDKMPMGFAVAPIAFSLANVLFRTHGEGFIKHLTVGQLLEGYPFSILDTIDTLTKPLKWLGIQLPDTGMPDNKFGLLSVKNYTKGGPYEVYTGQNGQFDKFLKFVSYQGKKTLDFYDDLKCNLMNGTDGTSMGAFLTKDQVLYVFNGDACKSVHAVFKEENDVRGIPTYRFIFPEDLFASPDKNPDNKCFCTSGTNYAKCDGIFDLGPCQKGAPLAFSFPHLMHCSQTIRDSVLGLDPNIEKHETFFDVHPILGAPLRASGKLQVNILVKPLPLVPGFGDVREAVVPFVWIEETAEIDDKYASMIKMVTIPIAVISNGSWVLALLGLAVTAGATAYGLAMRLNSEPLIGHEEDNTSETKGSPKEEAKRSEKQTQIGNVAKHSVNGFAKNRNAVSPRVRPSESNGQTNDHKMSADKKQSQTSNNESSIFTISRQNSGNKSKIESNSTNSRNSETVKKSKRKSLAKIDKTNGWLANSPPGPVDDP